MQKNKLTKLVEECHCELRRMWRGIIVYEENLLILQIGQLTTSVCFQLIKDPAVVPNTTLYYKYWKLLSKYTKRFGTTDATPSNGCRDVASLKVFGGWREF